MLYSPVYSGVWHDEALDGAPFEEKGFFVFLCSNHRIRPSGIYRVTDAQLAADTELPLKRVIDHLADLHRRGRIVRDGAWLFVRGYFSRQPKQEFLMRGVRRDLMECSSVHILESFSLKYPLQKQWSADRLAMIDRPSTESISTEQMQSRADADQMQSNGPSVVLVTPSPFDQFWAAYPNKTGKDDARAVWTKGKSKAGTPIPPIGEVLRVLDAARQSEGWTKDGGRFVPNPATWLRGGRWADEIQRQTRKPIMNGHNQAVLEQFIERRGE